PCLRRQCCERAGSGAAVPPTPCTGRRQTALAQDEAQEAAHPSPVPHALGSRSAPISVTMVRSTSNGSAGASGAAVAADAPVVAVMIGLSMVAVIALPLLSEGSERFVVPPGLRMDCRRAGFLRSHLGCGPSPVDRIPWGTWIRSIRRGGSRTRAGATGTGP